MNNIFAKIRQKPPGRKNAQGMLEFALVLPVLLLMIVGVIEFSRLMFAWVIIENSTRFGIRYAVTGRHETKYCANLDTNDKDPDVNGVLQADDGNAATGACVGENAEAEIDVARIPSIKDETRRIIIGFYAEEEDYQNLDPARVDDPYFLRLTVCSERGGRWFEEPVMSSSTYAVCHLSSGTSEDAADFRRNSVRCGRLQLQLHGPACIQDRTFDDSSCILSSGVCGTIPWLTRNQHTCKEK